MERFINRIKQYRRLQPAVKADPRQLRQLLADLDSEKFPVREAASKELIRLDELAEPALRRILKGKPSAETRRRIQAILEAPPPIRKGPYLRNLRAIQVLERIGTPEAQAVLKQLATGAPEARLTQEAKAALERLAKRPAAQR